MRYLSLYKFVKEIDKMEVEGEKITFYNLKKRLKKAKLNNAENTALTDRLIIECFRLTTALQFLTMRSHWRGQRKVNVYKKTFNWASLQKFIFKEIENNKK